MRPRHGPQRTSWRRAGGQNSYQQIANQKASFKLQISPDENGRVRFQSNTAPRARTLVARRPLASTGHGPDGIPPRSGVSTMADDFAAGSKPASRAIVASSPVTVGHVTKSRRTEVMFTGKLASVLIVSA